MSTSDFPVFDCNAALGRRHNRRVAYDRPDDVVRFLAAAGISKALVYHPYAVPFGTMEGNRFLLDAVAGHPELVPQFVVSFAVDDPDEVRAAAEAAGVRTLRVFPKSHGYPFVDWIAGPWLEWMARERMALWVPLGRNPEVDIRDLYETARRHPDVPVVLAGAHYSNYAAVWPLLKALDHIHLDLSRFDAANGIERLERHVGLDRLLFGSDFPEVDPKPYLHYLRHCGLEENGLRAICRDNLERLIAGERAV
ncbi:MAG TPA: amidohydrolase family protein [Bryobacteraceae bacterium]|nr:amidohydrolase family protein [Bryobacteraceae bacterium]